METLSSSAASAYRMFRRGRVPSEAFGCCPGARRAPTTCVCNHRKFVVPSSGPISCPTRACWSQCATMSFIAEFPSHFPSRILGGFTVFFFPSPSLILRFCLMCAVNSDLFARISFYTAQAEVVKGVDCVPGKVETRCFQELAVSLLIWNMTSLPIF